MKQHKKLFQLYVSYYWFTFILCALQITDGHPYGKSDPSSRVQHRHQVKVNENADDWQQGHQRHL